MVRFKEIVFVVCTLMSSSMVNASNSAGELELKYSDGSKGTALLLATHISGKVSGMIASIKIEQRFENDSDDWVNGHYVFPLPEGAAVDSLRIEIGDRIIDGIIKEKAEAKKIFEKAKHAGKKAGLLEQHRPNLFSVSLANIAPHEFVIANITFIDKVNYNNETFSLRLPTTLTPRYIPGAAINPISTEHLEMERENLIGEQHETIINGSGWSTNTDRVGDASDITPPQNYTAGGKTDKLFTLALSIDAGLNLQTVASNTHRISSNFITSKQVDIGLVNSQEPMNRDLQISWQPIVGETPKAALFQQIFEGAYYSLLMLTPPSTDVSLSLPRDITFIVDSSGSMAGDSMRQAKQALLEGLNFLNSGDRFNIIDFDSSYRLLFQHPRAVTSENLNQARTMINLLNANGGTEMLGALGYALNNNSANTADGQGISARGNRGALRQIVFITDGAIGNEVELFSLLHEKLADARLFTIGIGSAPNSYFMNKAAQFGRGSYTYISELQNVSEKMTGLFKRITHPIMRDIKIDWRQNNVEQYPQTLGDLYAGEPLTVLVKSDKPIRKITASGKLASTTWKQSIKLAKQQAGKSQNLDTVWARQKIAGLMDKLVTSELSREVVKPLIVKLGVAHGIVSKFTSFVAVEQRISKPDHLKSKHKNTANLMPKGSTMPIPQTGTASNLLILIGFLMLLLGLLISRPVSRHA